MANYEALFALGCLVGVAAIFYGPWQGVCIEFARQIIFEQREKLFDLAADGKMSFDSDEYRQLRDFLNKSIRFSHEMSLWNFILVQRHLRRHPPKESPTPLSSIVHSVSGHDAREAVHLIIDKSSWALVVAMAARSLPALIGAGVFYFARSMGLATGFSRKLRRAERAVRRGVEMAQS